MANIQQTSFHNEEQHLEQENTRLKSLLNSLIEKVETNQAIQKKFQNLEFDLLNTTGLSQLLQKLTIDFKALLDVDLINLVLFDPYQSTQELLHEIYPETLLNHVEFVEQSLDLEQRYQSGLKTQLRQKNTYLSCEIFHNHAPVQSMALVPLCRNGLLIGSYHLGSFKAARFSVEMSTDFLDHFAQIIAICIENTINTDRLKHMSLIDPLTRTKNRRCLYQALSKEVARAERETQSLSCLFIDLDHFKAINDTHGHPIGDKVLCHVAKVIQQNLRTTDLLARFGGEEFTVLLPNTDRNTAFQIAERIRTTIERQKLHKAANQTFRITASIGGTTWDPVSQPTAQSTVSGKLLKAADDAVYEAKHQGRNIFRWKAFEHSLE